MRIVIGAFNWDRVKWPHKQGGRYWECPLGEVPLYFSLLITFFPQFPACHAVNWSIIEGCQQSRGAGEKIECLHVENFATNLVAMVTELTVD